VPPAIVKRRQPLEPITYDELMSNAGMSGFVSFLEHTAPAQPADVTEVRAAPAGPLPYPARETPARLPKGPRGRIRKATTVEDGHSLAEEAVYTALWKAAAPLSEAENADRTIRIGYHRLAQMTRLSWVSVKANLRSLERKLALQVIGSENSATQEGKSYLVYSRATILEQRRRAGLEWVLRTRGVQLFAQAPVAETPMRAAHAAHA